MERQSPSKILQLNEVCTTLYFVLRQDIGPPKEHSGTTLFYLYDEYHAYECITTFALLSGTGFDQSARGLDALNYVKYHLK